MPRVLVVDDRIPTPHMGAGYGRMYDCLRALLDAGDLAVDFHPRQLRTLREPLADELRGRGVRMVRDLDRHLTEHGAEIDIVLMSRPHNYEFYEDLLETLVPGVPVVYDAEAVYHRRASKQAALAEDDEDRRQLEREAVRLRTVEERLFSKADHVVCISEEEAALAREHARGPVTVIEAWLADVSPTRAGFGERRHAGLVAGWNGGASTPNADGLLWFGREVLPHVLERLPDFRLRVTGESPPDNVLELAGDAVEFVGRVEDLAQFYNEIRVAISPVRFGAGVKLKSIEALQSGVPLVGTVEGCAGLDPRLAGAFHGTDDAQQFADRMVELLTDQVVWEQSRETALRAGELQGRTVAAWPEILRAHVAVPTVRTRVRRRLARVAGRARQALR